MSTPTSRLIDRHFEDVIVLYFGQNWKPTMIASFIGIRDDQVHEIVHEHIAGREAYVDAGRLARLPAHAKTIRHLELGSRRKRDEAERRKREAVRTSQLDIFALRRAGRVPEAA